MSGFVATVFSIARRVLRPLSLALALLCLPTCGETANPANPVDRVAQSPVQIPDAWTGRFDLPDGSQLLLKAPPMAVLPGSAGSVDMLVALLPPERLAGLPEGSERYSALRAEDSPYLARPTFPVFRAEQLLALAPDLVLAHSWQPAETIARLQEAGVPVLRLADGNSWAEVRGQLLLLGQLLGVEDVSAELLADYDRRVEALLATHGAGPPLTAVCYSNGGAGGWVAGSETTLDEVLRLAGLTNMAGSHGKVGHGTMTFEELLVLDPDVLVVGGAADAQQAGGTAAFLRESEALSALQAVVNDRIVVLPSWLYTTTSQYIVDAAEDLAERTVPWAVKAER